MACDPLIDDPFRFPAPIDNRPGLPRIAYRIGRYADFVEAMTRGIDEAPELAAFTHREADDPAIALLQGAAILCDILSFYQEHYANEAFLRTAAWRESVAGLVRLTGYRLAPGLGGRATLAMEARGAAPLVLRQGFPVKLELQGASAPADFETDIELTVFPHLGRFNLYSPRHYGNVVAETATRFEITAVDAAADSRSLAAFDVKIGDRLLLQPSEPSYVSTGSAVVAQQAPQLVKVKSVKHVLDRLIVETDAPLTQSFAAPATAFRIGRAFRHFGHDAPPQTTSTIADGSGKITGSTQWDTGFDRHVSAGHVCSLSSASIPLPATLLPLDRPVDDFTPGSRVIVECRIGADVDAARLPLSVTRRIVAAHTGSLGFGNLNGASAQLTLDAPLVRVDMSPRPVCDIRDVNIYEVTSPPLTIRPLSDPSTEAFVDGTRALYFYGAAEEARPLAGRRLFLAHADGRSVELVNTNEPDDFAAAPSAPPRRWALSFDRAPAPFGRVDFDDEASSVVVFGNLVDASQGKSEPQAVLGNGDARAIWQTFPLPKAPLTYFLSPDSTPARAPELDIFIGGRRWTRVDSFYGHGPKETIYILREDDEGRSFVQFGDGETGARLPSGSRNVIAVYRSGSCAHGAIAPGKSPTAPERPPGFDKVSLVGLVSGGADPESGEKAREAAPGKVQSLGRLVSVQDYETELLSIPGVIRAAAAFDLHAGAPAMLLRVQVEAGREAEFAAIRDSILSAHRKRGADRFPLVVRQALPRFVFVDLNYALDPSYRREDVEASLRAAFGLAGDAANEGAGLFGLRARKLGDPEYASRIEGRMQNVAGVLWCAIVGLGRFAAGAVDPATLLLPAHRRAAARLPCGALEILRLDARHLTLTSVADAGARA